MPDVTEFLGLSDGLKNKNKNEHIVLIRQYLNESIVILTVHRLHLKFPHKFQNIPMHVALTIDCTVHHLWLE